MKKFILVLLIVINISILTGCNDSSKNKNNENVIKATLNEDGDIIIDESEITEEATFLSYEIDGVTISFIVVRGTDGNVRVAFNTCQSCNPSPNAYFVQIGEYFECQNCGSRFHVDDIGVKRGGCNPAPVDELKAEDGFIIISKEYAKTYKDNFENWNGPKA